MTWINGVSYVGDLAHDHEGEEDHDAGTMSLYAPFDFDAGSRQLGSSIPRVLASSSGDLQDPVDDFLGVPSDESAEPEWMDVVAIVGLAADESSSSFDSELFAKTDSAFSDLKEDWLLFEGILR